LEKEGLVTRRAVYGDIPLRVEYKLTPLAKELDAIFIGLEKRIAKWESRNNRHYLSNLSWDVLYSMHYDYKTAFLIKNTLSYFSILYGIEESSLTYTIFDFTFNIIL